MACLMVCSEEGCITSDCCSLQAMLTLADADGDGVVDLNDFYRTMRKTSAF